MATMHVEIVSAEGERGIREASLRARERARKDARAGIERQRWLAVGSL
jgi:hypothetical protein